MASKSIDIQGIDSTKKKINQLQIDIQSSTRQAINIGAQDLRTNIRHLFSKISHGRTYKRGNIKHIASRKGDPPNNDRGILTKTLRIIRKRHNRGYWAGVRVGVKYAIPLEKTHPYVKKALMATKKDLFPRIELYKRRVISGYNKK